MTSAHSTSAFSEQVHAAIFQHVILHAQCSGRPLSLCTCGFGTVDSYQCTPWSFSTNAGVPLQPAAILISLSSSAGDWEATCCQCQHPERVHGYEVQQRRLEIKVMKGGFGLILQATHL